MKDRKQDILDRALELFNQKGFYNVSLKEIAFSLGISPGNLTYHFPKKEQLLADIQANIIADADIKVMPEGYITLYHLEQLFQAYFKNQKRYKFYFNNLLYIFKAFPEIAQEYRRVSQERLFQARKLINYYIETDRFLAESKQIHYPALIRAYWMCNIFWSGHEAVLGNVSEGSEASQIEILWQLTLPYLTSKGFEEYQEIQGQKNKNY